MKCGCGYGNIRVARALGTAQVLAVLALSSVALEEGVTLMTCPAHTLRRFSHCHLLPSRAVKHGESISFLVQHVIGGESDGKSFAL